MSENELDLDDLLANQEIEGVEDLPDMVSLPNGTYILAGVSAKSGKTGKKKPKYGITFKKVSCEEVREEGFETTDEVDEKYPADSLSYFMFSDEEPKKVLSRLKKVFGETMAEQGMSTFGQLFDQFDQLTFACDVTRRERDDSTEDDPAYFTDIKKATIV